MFFDSHPESKAGEIIKSHADGGAFFNSHTEFKIGEISKCRISWGRGWRSPKLVQSQDPILILEGGRTSLFSQLLCLAKLSWPNASGPSYTMC